MLRVLELVCYLYSINRNRLKEIIVVDGGSTDGTIAIAKANKAKVWEKSDTDLDP